ncbi:MAG: DUF1376 domain-containing protein [Alphaproteobacteria bacterium]|nr:DUF1376 domain-containing protein [Alphaproteobacteria bacterium]MBL6939441.1 DUF1376 domain-containing protein [Alphaproteobacteria bacterium]MBL7097078.1 DUF1376 domain-containing protein [Alphaproteobacteria bacterium]
MPLDVVRLRESTFAATVTGDEYRAGTMLWAASWHQVPAGSVPSDDVNLAKLAGYGFAVDVWRKLRAGALRGFIACNNGRLYHAVVCEIAWPVWLERVRYFHAAECDRIRKANAKVKAQGVTALKPEPTVPGFTRLNYPATARHLDVLDQMVPAAGWSVFLERRNGRGRKGVPGENLLFPPERDGEGDTYKVRSSGTDDEKPPPDDPFHRKTLLKGEEKEEITPLTPLSGGARDGLADAGEWTQDADFMAFVAAGGEAWVGARLDRTWLLWTETAGERPDAAQLCAAVRAYFAWRLRQGNGSRAPTPIGPTTFLRSRHWHRFEQPETALDPAVVAWRGAMAERWPPIDQAALLRAGLRDVEARAWFGGVFVDAGPPRRLLVQRPFEANWIEKTYRQTTLRRLAGAEGWDVDALVIAVEGGAA